MIRLIFRFIFWVNGWHLDVELAKKIDKCVFISAPHTSALDFVYGRVALDSIGKPARFAIKKEFFFFPMGFLLKSLGGTPINRNRQKDGTAQSIVDAMADLFKKEDKFFMIITPEGTRSKQTQWKTGFYYVAKKANVPIVLTYLDYEKKHAVVGEIFYTTDSFENDMRHIMQFYKGKKGKFPDRFSLDERFV